MKKIAKDTGIRLCVFIFILTISMLVGGVHANTDTISGERLLTDVSQSLSFELDQVDANITTIAKEFSSTEPATTVMSEIIKPYHLEKSGTGGVALIAGDITHSSLNTSVIPEPLNLTILQDSSVTDSIKYIKPKFSQALQIDEQNRVVLMTRPTLVNNIIGVVVMLIEPDSFIEAIVAPSINGTGALCVVMEPDGTILYSSHPDEQSKVPPENFMTEFPTFRDISRAMMNTIEGNQAYELWRADRTEPKSRIAYWNTITLHGTDWRVMVAMPT